MSRVTGVNEIQLALNKFAFDLDKAVDQAVRATAFAVEKTAVKSINEESVGRTYRRGNITHVASKEGDAPNTDSGRLAGSISVKHIIGAKKAYVYTPLDYGEWLEFGTERIEPRPWLEPARDEEQKGYSKRLESAIDKQIEKAGA